MPLRVTVPSSFCCTPFLATSGPVATSGGQKAVQTLPFGALLSAVQGSWNGPFGENGKLSPENTYRDRPAPVTKIRPNLLLAELTTTFVPAALACRAPLPRVAAAGAATAAAAADGAASNAIAAVMSVRLVCMVLPLSGGGRTPRAPARWPNGGQAICRPFTNRRTAPLSGGNMRLCLFHETHQACGSKNEQPARLI